MKALAVREPWASLIASGRKTIEVRTWRTTHRGPLVVVASKSYLVRDFQACGVVPRPCTLAALVQLVEVRRFRRSDFRAACIPPRPRIDDLYAWVLDDVQPLVRSHYDRARLMLWDLEDDVRVRVARKGR